jgi:two-component system OmpR family sensor kinase
MRTLRGRLLIGLTALIIAFSVCAGVLSYDWSFDEAIEFQDAVLVQVAALTPSSPVLEAEKAPSIDKDVQIVVEELSKPTGMLPRDLSEGFHTVTAKNEAWRVLVRNRSDGSRIAVAQPTAGRDEVARDSALKALIPLGVLLPTLILVVTFVIHLNFRPLSALTAKLDATKIDALQRLEVEPLPGELIPFVRSINRLLERLEAAFRQQRRFIADASHELRSPITALSLQVQNVDASTLPPEQQERLAKLNKGVARLRRLIDQLLTLARFEEERPEQAETSALDVTLLELVAEMVPEADAFDVDLGFTHIEPSMVPLDAFALRVLARNLIENAMRHSPRGGRIDLVVERQGGKAVLAIEDAGPGIPDDVMPRVFEPFYRGPDASSEGNGLGLAIVHQIAGRSGASVSLENIEHDGRTGLKAVVIFPLAPDR